MNKVEKGIQSSMTENIVSTIQMIKDGIRPNKSQLIDNTMIEGMKEVLLHRASVARKDGWDGWYGAEECTMEHLEKLLQHHVDQGSMVNVALLAGMIHIRSHGLG